MNLVLLILLHAQICVLHNLHAYVYVERELCCERERERERERDVAQSRA